MIRKLFVGAVVALLFAGAAQAQSSVVIRQSSGSGPVTADANGLEVQGPGVAGAPAGGVMSVQGVASGTPVRVDCVTGCSGGGGGGGAVTIADGAAVNLGALADAAWSGTGNASITSILKSMRGQLASPLTVNLGTIAGAATAAKQDAAAAHLAAIATAAADPTPVAVNAASSSGVRGALIQADASVPIAVTSATTTQLVAALVGKRVYVTAWDVVAGGTGTLKLVAGTGASCATGAADLTGAYAFEAGGGIAKGSGVGPVLVGPIGAALCVTTSAAVPMAGSLAFTQQ